MEDKNGIPELVLEYHDARSAEEKQAAMGKIYAKDKADADLALINVVEGSDETLRPDAIFILSMLQMQFMKMNPDAVYAIAEQLADSNPKVRMEAANALWHLGSGIHTIPIGAAMLYEKNGQIWDAMNGALCEIGRREEVNARLRRREGGNAINWIKFSPNGTVVVHGKQPRNAPQRQ